MNRFFCASGLGDLRPRALLGGNQHGNRLASLGTLNRRSLLDAAKVMAELVFQLPNTYGNRNIPCSVIIQKMWLPYKGVTTLSF